MRGVVVVLVLVAGGAVGREPAARKALEPFQGKWEVVQAWERGEAIEADKLKKFPVTFEGDQMEMAYEGQKTVKWTVTVRPDKSPREIDAALPKRVDGGKVIRGIYRFDDGVLKIALDLDKDSTRPQNFEPTGKDRPTLVMVLRKAR